MMNKRLVVHGIALLVMLALVGALSGCATSGESGPPASPAAQPKYGGILRLWQSSEPSGWDMHRMISYSPSYAMPIYNNLVRFDITKPELSPENLIPDLAERWEVSPDGMTITFFLYKGVKWHDGKPFTADDVVYSIEKMMDSKRSSVGGVFPGYKSVVKIDDYTVKVNLSKPQPSFLVNLAGPFEAMQPKHLANVDWRSTDFLVGTGPYKFKNRVAGVSYELVKNPDYFRKGLPYLDGIHMSVIADRSAQVDAFASKRVDMTSAAQGITNQETLTRYQDQGKGMSIGWKPSQVGPLVWFNLAYTPLKDVRVRRALALVTDMKQAVIGGFGSDRFRNGLAHGIFPPAYGLPIEEINGLLGRDRPMDVRVAEAKKLMTDTGYSGGFKLKMVATNVAEPRGIAVAIGDMYRRYLNIDVELVSLPTAEAQRLRDAKDFGTVSEGMSSWVGDPDEIARSFRSGSPGNYSGYSNPEVDKLLDQQSVESNPEKRRKIVQDIERILLTDLPVIPEGQTTMAVGWWPYVKGFVEFHSTYASHLQFERVWLDK